MSSSTRRSVSAWAGCAEFITTEFTFGIEAADTRGMRSVAALLLVIYGFSSTSSLWSNDVAETVVWHSFGFAASALLWFGATGRSKSDRAGWVLIALGMTAWVAGDVAWDVVTWDAPLPDASIVDAFYLSGYLCLIAGVVVMTRRVTGSLPGDAVIDGSIVAIAVGLVFWVSLVEPSLDPGDAVSVLVAASYPILAVTLFAALTWMRFHPHRHALPPGVGLLGAAVFLLVVLEPFSAWFYFAEPGLDLEAGIDRAFHLSFALMTLSTYQRGEGRPASADHGGLHPVRFVLLGAALAAGPLTLLLVSEIRSPALGASAAISTLVLIRFVSITRDRERVRAELERLATRDALTGLANRRTFSALLAESGSHRGIDLLYVDVDRFKEINDTHGHAAGDSLLCELAARLRDALGPDDVGVRLGGDEFAAVCAPGTGIQVAEALLQLTAQPFELGDARIDVSLSIGRTACELESDIELDTLLEQADAALYQAKRDGRSRFVDYDVGVYRWLVAQRNLEAELRSAHRAGTLPLQLSPLVSEATGKQVGNAAALVLELADGDPVVLDIDDPLVERSGLAGRLAVDSILAALAIDDAGPLFVRTPLAFLRSTELVDDVVEAISASSRVPALVFSVEEDELMTLQRDHGEVLDSLRDLGIRFALTTFGLRGSSLVGVHALPADFVRIDAVRSVLPDEALMSLCELAEALGVEPITAAHDDLAIPIRAGARDLAAA